MGSGSAQWKGFLISFAQINHRSSLALWRWIFSLQINFDCAQSGMINLLESDTCWNFRNNGLIEFLWTLKTDAMHDNRSKADETWRYHSRFLTNAMHENRSRSDKIWRYESMKTHHSFSKVVHNQSLWCDWKISALPCTRVLHFACRPQWPDYQNNHHVMLI